MRSYTVEFNGTGEVIEGYFATDSEAEAWAESVLENRGYSADDLFSSDWQADGTGDDGETHYRICYWASEADAENDPGVNAICQLCKVGE